MDPGNADRLQWIIERRRACEVAFDPHWHVSEEDLARLLEAARCAPSGHEPPGFRLIVVDDHRLLARLAEAGQRIAGAPTMIFVVADPARDDGELGALSLGCVLENMWLAAQASHLDVEVVTAIGRDTPRLLGIPAGWRIAYALRVGHAEAGARLVTPEHPELVVHRNRFEEVVS